MALLLLTLVTGAAESAEEASVRFAFIGLHGGVFEELIQIAKPLAVRVDYVTDEAIAKREVDFAVYRAVFIQHVRAEDKEAYRALFAKGKAGNADLRFFSLSGLGKEIFRDLEGNVIVEEDPELSAYYTGSRENLRRLLVYALVKLAGRKDFKVEPPEPSAGFGLFHPEHPGLFASVGEFAGWLKSRARDPGARPIVAVAVHDMHLQLQQPRVVEALIRRLEKDGTTAVAVLDTPDRAKYEAALLELKPDVVIHTCHCMDSPGFRARLGVPHLCSIFFRQHSIAEWRGATEGLASSEAAFQIVSQEVHGSIEPQIGAGTRAGHGSPEALLPIDDRINHLALRTAAWLRLRRERNDQKRVAVVYYDRELGKSELLRGSATGMFLNGPRSLLKVLARLKEVGYAISPVPRTEEELLDWLLTRGRQVGVWAQAELERLVSEGNPALVPAKKYEAWLEKRVPKEARNRLLEVWGKPPGRLMVWRDAQGEEFIVIPRVELGNVILLPQPLRGEAHEATRLVHDRLTPPPHNYLATYFWLEEEFHASALIHFGTHGSELSLPGKNAGLSDLDWPDIVLGAMPNVNPWIIENLGESSPAKRRAYAVLTSHLTPPIVTAELSDELESLHRDLDKWEPLEPGALREKFAAAITQGVRAANLDKDLHLDLPPERVLTEAEILRLAEHLHSIEGETTPVSLHVLGEPPREDLLVPFLVTCLRKKFLDDLGALISPSGPKSGLPGDRAIALRSKAEEAVELVVHRRFQPEEAIRAIGGQVPSTGLPEGVAAGLALAVDLNARFQQTPEEIESILKALDGKFVAPGPGNSPSRNPGSVPTGKNLYVLNPEEVPSRPSWELARGLVDKFLRDHLAKHGHYPVKVGFDLSSFATFRDYGVMESQIFYLIGVEPVWDEKGLVGDVKVIPRESLGRPRIDVFISSLGYYRDNLPSRMVLLDKAIRRVADLEEEGNGPREGSARIERTLLTKGMPAEKARSLSSARIFGYPEGQYGSMAYYYLLERSGEWDTREQLMEAYLAQVRNVYTDGEWGTSAPETYNAAIQGTEVVLRSWSDPMTSPLSNKYTWFQGGSLSLAVKHLTGKEPEFRITDVRDPDRSQVVSSEDALRKDFRVRLFNRKWIEGMMKEGYAGADQVSVMTSNTLGWEVMREGSVTDDIWEEIQAIYFADKLKLGIPEWFDRANPFAQQETAEVLLEAARKGYWKADPRSLLRVAEAYATSVARHGEGDGLRSGANTKLEAFVERTLTAPGVGKEALIQAMKTRPAPARTAGAPAAAASPVAPAAPPEKPRRAEGRKVEAVQGQRLEPVDARTSRLTAAWRAMSVAAACVGLFAFGFFRRRSV